ncbi:MAG: hypothetical protein M3Y87_08085 [Myxococcota bacterium]|nr:hypothetical protein [Myxococcota bacterium]
MQIAQVEASADLDVDYDYGMPQPTAEQIGQNYTLMDWTRGLNVATTLALAVTGVLGFIQFGDEYGFNDAYDQTACATNDAVLGYCAEETPWAHAIAAGTSATLLVSSFAVSTQIDFDQAARHDSDWRVYETTRWIALGMGVLQAAGGFFLANSVRWGWLDEQQDFDTMQALAGGHMALGVATLGINAANSLLLF